MCRISFHARKWRDNSSTSGKMPSDGRKRKQMHCSNVWKGRVWKEGDNRTDMTPTEFTNGTTQKLPCGVNTSNYLKYRIYSRNLRTSFLVWQAEKSECVKYADFPAFWPRNALLSLFAVFNHSFFPSNNARGLQNSEFPLCCTVSELSAKLITFNLYDAVQLLFFFPILKF
jgi:hypothetical protein